MPDSSTRLQPYAHLIGCRLSRDIFNEFGAVILPKHTLLNEENLFKIQSFHLTLTSADVESLQEDIVQSTSKKFVEEATAQIKEIFRLVRVSGQIPLTEVSTNIIPAVQQAAANPNLFKLFTYLQSKDDYTYRHNIGVGAIATLIGRWMGLTETDLSLLTIAATLHDIGKTRVPDEILNKPDKLTPDEYAFMKQHTLFGYDIIKNITDADDRIALVAVQHHEREDGSGYPYGLKRDQIDFFSKLVAVADVFHAMTSQRSYHEAAPFYRVIEEMRQGIYGQLEPSIVLLFTNKVMETIVGHDILLTNGETGRVLFINQNDPTAPLVQVGSSIVDLSKEKTIQLQQVIS